jgi:hemerythrin
MPDNFTWNPVWETGDETIDDQHKGLVAQVDRLLDAAVTGEVGAETERALQHLAWYVERHFEYEERRMVETAYPGLGEHKQAHDELRERVKALIRSRGYLSKGLTGDLMAFLVDWFQGHFTTLDRALARHLKGSVSEAEPLPPSGASRQGGEVTGSVDPPEHSSSLQP